jgi:hypothetical protein
MIEIRYPALWLGHAILPRDRREGDPQQGAYGLPDYIPVSLASLMLRAGATVWVPRANPRHSSPRPLHRPNLLQASEGMHSAGDDRRRQTHKTQTFAKFLARGKAPPDKLLEFCKLLRVIVLLIQQQPTVGHDGI